jgi:hypothetical protein
VQRVLYRQAAALKAALDVHAGRPAPDGWHEAQSDSPWEAERRRWADEDAPGGTDDG